ncbi:MAG: hypothetical protein IJN56_04020 [Clostridia bacterium]|nr:hypothetical protein [Clostridia bacterium]
MENQPERTEIKAKNMYISICITQAVCVTVILIAVLVIKYFFSGSYVKLEKWYSENIMEETEITADFDEEITSEI